MPSFWIKWRAWILGTWEEQIVSRWLQGLREYFYLDSTTDELDHLKAVWLTAVADQEISQVNKNTKLAERESEIVQSGSGTARPTKGRRPCGTELNGHVV